MKFAQKRVAGFASSALLAAGLLIAPALAPYQLAGPIPTASAACPDAELQARTLVTRDLRTRD